MSNRITIGTEVFVPENLNNGERCKAKVVGIYNRFILLEKEDKTRMTIQITDFSRYIDGTDSVSEESAEMEADILANL